MEKINYIDIANDKENLLKVINKMIPIYKLYKHHTQVLECEQWITMLIRNPIVIEYTPDALLVLNNILNDAVNYLIAVEGNWDDGELSMNLMTKIVGLFNKNKGDS